MKKILTFISIFLFSFFAFAQDDCQEFLNKIEEEKSYNSNEIIQFSNDFYNCIENKGISLINQMQDLEFISKSYPSGIFIAKMKRGYCLFNLKENTYSKNYNLIEDLNENYSAVKCNEGWGFINQKGKEIISCKYESVKGFSNSLAGVSKNNKWGFINKQGKTIIPLIYDNINSFSSGFASVEKNGKYGVIDSNGKIIIPFNYDYLTSFTEELFAVKSNNKWGYIDKNNKLIIPFVYDFANEFRENLAFVGIGDYEFFIDKFGNEVIEINNKNLIVRGNFNNGLALVEVKSKYGFINKKGEISIPASYDDADSFKSQLSNVKIDGLRFYINTKGECVKDCENAPTDHPRANN